MLCDVFQKSDNAMWSASDLPAKRHRCLVYGIQSWPIRIEYPQGMYQFYSLGETVGESNGSACLGS